MTPKNTKWTKSWKDYIMFGKYNLEASGEWKTNLTMKIDFILSKDNDERLIMYSESDKLEIMTGSNKNETLNGISSSLLTRYHFF